MGRWRLDVAYEGTSYHGFARQPGTATVQGELEEALSRIFRAPVVVSAAGRTDAGVHASGQVVAFDAPAGHSGLDDRRLLAGLNALLPPDIRALALTPAARGFDPRREALAREYLYLVAGTQSPLLRRLTWYRRRPLDEASMAAAAGRLVGVRDFTSFCRADVPEPRVRELFRLDVWHAAILGTELTVVRALANAFLHGMVRTLAGTLVQIGEGRRSPDDAQVILASRDRRTAGQAAPAQGLVLVRVIYDAAELVTARAEQASSQLTRYVGLLDMRRPAPL